MNSTRTALAQRDRAQREWVRRDGAALDVSALPSFGFSHRSILWWATAGLMTIESVAFALAVAAYYYLRVHASTWPMSSAPPQLLWGTLNTAILLASLVPNHRTKAAAERLDLPGVRRGLAVCIGFAIAFLALRVLEFRALNVRWDDNAYGSVVWLILGLHTVHLVTDCWDSVVLAALMHRRTVEGRRFVDVSENALYWVFVVLSWLPLYAVLYLSPRAG